MASSRLCDMSTVKKNKTVDKTFDLKSLWNHVVFIKAKTIATDLILIHDYSDTCEICFILSLNLCIY